MDLVEAVLEHGAALTKDSLTAATRSRNPNVVLFLLRLGADADGFSLHFRSTPYAEALVQNDTALASLFEKGGCLKNIREPYRLTAALAAASRIGNLSMVRKLVPLARGCCRILGYALIKAAESNCTAIAQVLLEAGSAVSQPENLKVFELSPQAWASSCIPMNTAIQNRNQDIVRLLLDHEGVGRDSVHSLRKAITTGAFSVVQDLVEAGVCEERKSEYQSPQFLKLAVRTRDYMLVEYMVSCGFAFGKALNEAVKISDMDMVCKLLEIGATPDPETLISTFCKPIAFFEVIWVACCNLPWTQNGQFSFVLSEALGSNRFEIVGVLLQHHGALPTYVDLSRQETVNHFEIRLNKDGKERHLAPIGVAILHDRTPGFQIVQLLLNRGVLLDSTVTYVDNSSLSESEPRETALLLAIGTGRADLVELLISYDADVNQPNGLGIKRTPLQKAAETGTYSIVKLLLQCGANPNGLPSARNGGTAIQFAAMGGFTGIFELLLRHGADLNALPSQPYGRMPLEGAAEHGRFDMVIYLLRLSPQFPKRDIESAMCFAKSNGHSAIVDVLEGYCRERESMPVIGHVEERKSHVCDICQLPFSKASARARHQNTIHASALARAKFACEDCGEVCGRKDLLLRHKNKHSRRGYVFCGSCGKDFRKDYLKKHLPGCQHRN
jgi:ankyrin repeat protein